MREALRLLRVHVALDAREYPSTEAWHEAEAKWEADAITLLAKGGA